MDALVGYTGFVGGNLAKLHNFQKLYNSRNISDILTEKFDMVVYSGIPGAKFLANTAPDEDLLVINNAIEIISKIKTDKFILISTVDVYHSLVDVDESSKIDTSKLHPYGRNRRVLEEYVISEIPNAYILRLPALYGDNLKKNFIYDIIHIIPFMIKPDKMKLLDGFIQSFYTLNENNFYRLNDISEEDKVFLKQYFEKSNFNALSFTDSESQCQYLNLKKSFTIINTMLKENIKLLNAVTEPLSANEIYTTVYNKPFTNHLDACPIKYNIKTKYGHLFSDNSEFILNKNDVLQDLSHFIHNQK